MAVDAAKKALEASAVDHSVFPFSCVVNASRMILKSSTMIWWTLPKQHSPPSFSTTTRITLVSTVLECSICVAKLAVDAVLRIKDSGNLDYIQIIKKNGGLLKDSYLEDGFILEKEVFPLLLHSTSSSLVLVRSTNTLMLVFWLPTPPWIQIKSRYASLSWFMY